MAPILSTTALKIAVVDCHITRGNIHSPSNTALTVIAIVESASIKYSSSIHLNKRIITAYIRSITVKNKGIDLCFYAVIWITCKNKFSPYIHPP